MIETGIVDWSLDRQSGQRTETMQGLQTLVRFGLNDHLEAQIAWNGYGHVRSRNLTTGALEKSEGIGDLGLALRQNLMSPDGSGTSVAVMPFINFPVGQEPIGDSDWSAGVIVPLSFSLPYGIGLALSPEIDASVNESGHARHLAFGSVIGLSFPITEYISLVVEKSWFRDYDPTGHSSAELSGTAIAWQLSNSLQLDLGFNKGIKKTAPDKEFYMGISKRF